MHVDDENVCASVHAFDIKILSTVYAALIVCGRSGKHSGLGHQAARSLEPAVLRTTENGTFHLLACMEARMRVNARPYLNLNNLLCISKPLHNNRRANIHQMPHIARENFASRPDYSTMK